MANINANSGTFQVNTITANDQIQSSVTALGSGGFLVTWTSGNTNESDVYGQRYDSSGNRMGTEFRINSYTYNSKHSSSVTGLKNGGFVVTWTSSAQDGALSGVYGQRYDSSGSRSGNEIRINSYTINDQLDSSVTGLNDGGFVVTWSSAAQDGWGWGVYGQRYDSSGNRSGNEFRINSHTTTSQFASSVTGLNGGGFVVTWSSDGDDEDGETGICAQIYNARGGRVSREFNITPYSSYERTSSVTALGDGGFVVVWQAGYTIDDDDYGNYPFRGNIYGQRYSANGSRVGSKFRVNDSTPYNLGVPSVTALQDGGFAIAWSSAEAIPIPGEWDAEFYQYVNAQQYSANGSRVGNRFSTVLSPSLGYYSPRVGLSSSADGGFIVTWEGTNSGPDYSTEIYGKRFHADGNPYQDFSGTPGDDSWTGGDGDDIIAGGEGNDNLYGGSGNDILRGGAGNDSLSGGGGIDSACYDTATSAVTVNLNTTAAQITGGDGTDTLIGIENLLGSNFNDTLTGNGAANILDGKGGADTMIGGFGNDTYYVDDSGDIATETSTLPTEIDTVISSVTRILGNNLEKLTLSGSNAISGYGNVLANTLTGNNAANVLDGKGGNDILLGKLGNDILIGRDGDDTISGGGNSDYLFGRDGNDTLTGGRGADTFVFDCALNSATNRDIITDFSHANDTVRLDRTIFTKFATGTLLSTQFRASSTGNALDRNDFFLYNTSTGALLYDADGSGAGAAVRFATLANTPTNVSYNDFVVVA